MVIYELNRQTNLSENVIILNILFLLANSDFFLVLKGINLPFSIFLKI